MERPLQITTHHVTLPPKTESLIEDQAARLETFYDRLIGCIVKVEGPGEHHRNGGPYRVSIDLRVPGGEPLVVSRKQEEELDAAVRSAFEAARRQLEEFASRQRSA